MRTTLPALAVLVVNLLSPVALGQESSPYVGYGIATSRRFAPPEAAHRHSSTVYEGAMRGEAAWITAAGEYLQDEAQAAILWQQVEAMHYENELNKTATALTRKKMLSDFRDYEKQRRLERKAQSKQLWAEKYQELARTYKLNEYQLNWETGAIYWPSLVASPRYAKHRERLDVLMHRLVTYGESRYGHEADEIAKVVSEFRKQLKDDFASDHPATQQEYSDMQRFLLGLKYAPVLLQNGGGVQTFAMR